MVSVLDRSLTLCLSRVTKKKVLIFISSICRAILPEYSNVQSLEAGHPPMSRFGWDIVFKVEL